METTSSNQVKTRSAAVQALAIVGFIALVIIGMALAVYAANFVPKVVSRVGSAAASLSQVFSPAATTTLQAVPSTGSTISFGSGATTATTTIVTTTTPTATTTTSTTVHTTPTPTPGTQTTTATAINGSTGTTPAPATLYGLPNLVTTITGVGYLNDSNDAFVPSSSVPYSNRLAIRFTVTNAGTNSTGSWNLSAVLPTKSNATYTFNSDTLRSLNPGEHIDFTLHLDPSEARIGNNETLTVTADPNNQVRESIENDNERSVTVTVTN